VMPTTALLLQRLTNETIYSPREVQSSVQNIQHLSLYRLRKRCRGRAFPCLEQHYERHSKPKQPFKDNDSQGVKGSRKTWFNHSRDIISRREIVLHISFRQG